VEFVDRPMSHDPHDQLLLQIRGAVSEYERSLIAERMRRGRRQKYLAGGLLPWTRAPSGYRVDPARLRDPAGVRLEATEAAIVAELFSTSLQEGKSLKAETQRLTKLSVPSPAGKPRWNQTTIRGILTNPVYTGTGYIGRSRPTEARARHSALVPIGRGRGGHAQTTQEEWTAVTQVPAVVTQEQFDLVQAKLAHNQQFARRNNTAYPYLLRAMVSCGTCRLGCIGRSSRGGYAYYVCVGRSHGTISHREEKCLARSIPVEQLDELVWQDVCEMILHPEQIATALYRAQGGQWLPHTQALKPLAHPQEIGHHGATGASLFVPLPLLIWRNGTHEHVFLVDIDACAPFVHKIHSFPPRSTEKLQWRATGCQPWVKFSPACFPMPGATDGGACVAPSSHCWSGSQHECQADLWRRSACEDSILFHARWCALAHGSLLANCHQRSCCCRLCRGHQPRKARDRS
jgi:hypothetical protein